MKKILIAIGSITLISLLLFFGYRHEWKPQEKLPLVNIDVQLKWLHQAQFAGMYVAQEKGFYAEEGINVNLIPFSLEGESPIEKVNNGSVDFAVTGSSEVAVARSEEVPIKAIAVIYKTSPYCIYSIEENNIKYPMDLKGKSVGIQDSDGKFLLDVVFKHQNMDPSSITKVPIGYSANELIAGEVDASMGYIINEPLQAIEAGYKINTMLMADYGANIYGDVLIASDKMINENPDLVLGFLRASLKGWHYAKENISETVSLVLKYAKNSTNEHETYMLRESIPLIHTGESPIGWMEDEEWATAKQTIKDDQKKEALNHSDCYTMQFLKVIYNKQ